MALILRFSEYIVKFFFSFKIIVGFGISLLLRLNLIFSREGSKLLFSFSMILYYNTVLHFASFFFSFALLNGFNKLMNCLGELV